MYRETYLKSRQNRIFQRYTSSFNDRSERNTATVCKRYSKVILVVTNEIDSRSSFGYKYYHIIVKEILRQIFAISQKYPRLVCRD